ncbi:succinylglutamate desuccinylase [Marinomonas algarum]|uniref:Succinylglutamate desuccinylase n=1 Tax=Marinomonas algarum TaxID=2883105 RepID=A0A9X1IKH5_9GAMM|nr:succinylglutamate desuccinylase [Marinomonas algarum]MCB5160935.1 succinylglutamate desuccinylase [Marinomonas algarum]
MMRIPNNDFLALTLANQESLSPFTVSFPSGCGVVEDTGILRLEPTASSDIHLVLSVGIHGNETGPIELVNQLVMAILNGQMRLTVRLLIVIGHPLAANQAKRFFDVNLNRLFDGAWQHSEGVEASRAARLEKAVSNFYAPSVIQSTPIKLHYDLHTAIRGSEYEKFAVHPFVEKAVYDQAQLSFLAACGIEAVLFSHQPTTTFSYHSYKVHQAHAFTIELGKVYPFGKNDLSRFSKLKDSLIRLIETGQQAHAPLSSLRFFTVLDSLIKDDHDYRLHIASDVKNFTAFESGYTLASSSKSQYQVQQTGDAIVFPNTQLPIGQRAGLMVRAIQPEHLTLT